jgi:hypothetical protein
MRTVVTVRRALRVLLADDRVYYDCPEINMTISGIRLSAAGAKVHFKFDPSGMISSDSKVWTYTETERTAWKVDEIHATKPRMFSHLAKLRNVFSCRVDMKKTCSTVNLKFATAETLDILVHLYVMQGDEYQFTVGFSCIKA